MGFRMIFLAAAALALAGCQTTSGPACSGWQPIRPTKADVAAVSDTLASQILAHNRQGQATCGWRP